VCVWGVAGGRGAVPAVSDPGAGERRSGRAGVVPVARHPCVAEKAAKEGDYWASWAGHEHRGGGGMSIAGADRGEHCGQGAR
jgi:hypothetical protein